ncbi:hypothetical protein [Microbacterium dauci]|uniref:PH domain-containing protein n=1 Tax=Microbacterium dauci TaxID=3048008 RepID=A0ABT6ZAM3_9MICO|nr:hypothetical protein [Microbacterium sp. LX3-4]MDJ1113217.1 hypothetical protein [Microbacterium sp. LX3-4]
MSPEELLTWAAALAAAITAIALAAVAVVGAVWCISAIVRSRR